MCGNGAPQCVKAMTCKDSFFQLARAQKATLATVNRETSEHLKNLYFVAKNIASSSLMLKSLIRSELKSVLAEHSLMSQTMTPATLAEARTHPNLNPPNSSQKQNQN